MKKDDRYQRNEYWAENQAMLNEKTHQQALTRNRLTTTDKINSRS